MNKNLELFKKKFTPQLILAVFFICMAFTAQAETTNSGRTHNNPQASEWKLAKADSLIKVYYIDFECAGTK